MKKYQDPDEEQEELDGDGGQRPSEPREEDD